MSWWLLRLLSKCVGNSWEHLISDMPHAWYTSFFFLSPKARNLNARTTMNCEREMVSCYDTVKKLRIVSTVARGHLQKPCLIHSHDLHFSTSEVTSKATRKKGKEKERKENFLAILGDNRRHK